MLKDRGHEDLVNRLGRTVLYELGRVEEDDLLEQLAIEITSASRKMPARTAIGEIRHRRGVSRDEGISYKERFKAILVHAARASEEIEELGRNQRGHVNKRYSAALKCLEKIISLVPRAVVNDIVKGWKPC